MTTDEDVVLEQTFSPKFLEYPPYLFFYNFSPLFFYNSVSTHKMVSWRQDILKFTMFLSRMVARLRMVLVSNLSFFILTWILYCVCPHFQYEWPDGDVNKLNGLFVIPFRVTCMSLSFSLSVCVSWSLMITLSPNGKGCQICHPKHTHKHRQRILQEDHSVPCTFLQCMSFMFDSLFHDKQQEMHRRSILILDESLPFSHFFKNSKWPAFERTERMSNESKCSICLMSRKMKPGKQFYDNSVKSSETNKKCRSSLEITMSILL